MGAKSVIAKPNGKYAIYIRVSTKKQGESGLGLEAQTEICLKYIKEQNGELTAVYSDTESGTHRDRKGLWDAIDHCKSSGATLVIAKLDRLARDVEFTFKVINEGINIHFCDMPIVNTLILGVFAAVAQYERELTSQRTSDALAALKAHGKRLGRPQGSGMMKACLASADSRRMTAQLSKENRIIWELIKPYEKDGKSPTGRDCEEVANKLKRMGVKSATGAEPTTSIVRNTYYRLKRIMRNCEENLAKAKEYQLQDQMFALEQMKTVGTLTTKLNEATLEVQDEQKAEAMAARAEANEPLSADTDENKQEQEQPIITDND